MHEAYALVTCQMLGNGSFPNGERENCVVSSRGLTASSEMNWLPCLLIGIVNAYAAGVCEPCELAPEDCREEATGMTDLETIQSEWASLEHRVSGVAVLVMFAAGFIFGFGAGALLIWWTL